MGKEWRWMSERWAKGDKIYDLGPKTVEYYSKLISGAGTVFISGPAGFFEKRTLVMEQKSYSIQLQTQWQQQL